MSAFVLRFRQLAPCALLLVAAGCGGGDGSTPTSPAAPLFALASVEVVVDGQVVNGMTVDMHQGGGATRFEARLHVDGQPASGGVAYCRYDLPGGGRMMQRQGVFSMFDDGTHGDRIPGDGVYCYQDDRAEYGCHGEAAGAGEYHYEFWGQHQAYGETMHRQVTVIVR